MSNEYYQPPQPPGPPPPPARPYGGPVEHVPDYVAFAILATSFCCLPFGLPAVYFTAKANGQKESGNIAGAIESAKKDKTWCWVAFGTSLAFWVLYIGAVAIAVAIDVAGS